MAAFEADPALVAYRVPGLLGVYLRNRWLQEQLNPTAPKSATDLLDLYLEEAVDHAGPELATAAAQALANLPDPLGRHAGDSGPTTSRIPAREVVVGPVHWASPNRDGLVGMGQVEWAGEVWGYPRLPSLACVKRGVANCLDQRAGGSLQASSGRPPVSVAPRSCRTPMVCSRARAVTDVGSRLGPRAEARNVRARMRRVCCLGPFPSSHGAIRSGPPHLHPRSRPPRPRQGLQKLGSLPAQGS